jgi:tetratricopeptide (TPR) repeat protein
VDLETIVLKAVAREPAERYATAQELADDLRRFLDDRPIRARRSPLWQRLRRWLRRHRTVVLATAATALLAVGPGIWAGWNEVTRRARTEQAIAQAMQAAERLEDEASWEAALAQMREAEQAAEHGSAGEDLKQRLRRRRADLEFAVRLEAVRMRRAAILDRRPDVGQSDQEYARAFREYGVDVEEVLRTAGPEGVAGRFPSTIRAAVVAALDDWAFGWRAARQADQGWKAVAAAARAADPDGRLDELRQALIDQDHDALVRVASAGKPDEFSASTLLLLGRALRESGDGTRAAAVLRQGQRRFPNDYWINHELAVSLRSAHPPQLDEAIRFASIAVSLRPKGAGPWAQLGMALLDRGRWDEAVGACREAARLEPDFAVHHDNLAYALRRNGQSEEALTECEEAIRLDPDDEHAYLTLSDVLQSAGRDDEAVAALQTVLRLRPGYAEARHNLGGLYLKQGRLDDAAAAFKEAARLKPDFVDPLIASGHLLRRKGHLDEAIAAYREAIRRAPRYAVAHSALAGALQEKGLPDEAIAVSREAVRLGPDSALFRQVLGDALLAKGMLVDALIAYKDAIKLGSKDPGLHLNLGHTLNHLGLSDDAVAAYREAIRLQPSYAVAHYALGCHFNNRRAYEQAVAAFEEAIRWNPDYAEAHLNLGVVFVRQGAPAKAEGAFRKALHLRPDYPEGHNNPGMLLVEKGAGEQAAAEFREAIRLRPGYAMAHLNLARLLLSNGEVGPAIAAFRQAVRYKPDDAEAYWELGHALRGAGQFVDALDALRKAHQLGSVRPNWTLPTADRVREVERLCELDKKLPAVIDGSAKAASNEELVELAQVCYLKRRYAAAARLSRDALAADPSAGNRYNAACAAALAGCGQGEDAGRLDEPERARWRQKALDWLRADLAAHVKRLEKGTPRDRDAVRNVLEHWRIDADLAGVRDTSALGQLPRREQEAWLKCWADVEDVLRRARVTTPKHQD